jgi:hypothetical protein
MQMALNENQMTGDDRVDVERGSCVGVLFESETQIQNVTTP